MNEGKPLLKVGILGCGPISQAGHFESAVKARNVELSTETIDKGEILFNQSAFGAALFSVSKGIEAGSA